jgi:hypothetical protein
VVEPLGLQDKIEEVLARHKGKKAFLRASGTEDVLRLHVEADTVEQVKAISEEVRDIVLNHPLLNWLAKYHYHLSILKRNEWYISNLIAQSSECLLHVLHSLLDLAEAMCQFLLAKLDLFHLAFQYFGKVNMVFESAVDFLLELSHIQLEVSLRLFHSHFENRA